MDLYTPANLSDQQIASQRLSRNELIGIYYQNGYGIREIIGFMTLRHDSPISERQVHRILRGMNLLRRGNESPLADIILAVSHELARQDQHIGYRLMRRRLQSTHHLTVTAETVRQVLCVLDRQGVAQRSRRSIRRRIYSNPGPNFAIHMDGWDKLKPYGVSIHAAIDGFSRRIIWLRACDSNKNPHYVAFFYLNYIREINGVPVLVYSDRGTENSITRDLQYTLIWNHNDQYQGLSSYRYGSSTRNTRIERFWRDLTRMCGDTWMDFFKLMTDDGSLDTSDNLHLECIRYCFLHLINLDLVSVVRQWNEQPIRYNPRSNGPFGKPDVLYFQPETFGTVNQKMILQGNADILQNEYCQRPKEHGVCQEFEWLANYIIRQRGLSYPPNSIDEAALLYYEIISYVRDNIQ